jgi:hypothetical protein
MQYDPTITPRNMQAKRNMTKVHARVNSLIYNQQMKIIVFLSPHALLLGASQRAVPPMLITSLALASTEEQNSEFRTTRLPNSHQAYMPSFI